MLEQVKKTLEKVRPSLQADGGDVTAIQGHIAAGSNLDEPDPVGGSTPLITAAAFGQTAAAKALIEGGAKVNATNKDGSTALHTAAFLCRADIVKALLATGADREIRNNAGSTALESVEAPFDAVKGIYQLIETVLGQCRKNKSEASRRLGVHRSTLLSKMEKYGIQ